MIITAEKLDHELNVKWPGIWTVPTDKKYYSPPKWEFNNYAQRAKTAMSASIANGYVDKIYECEDIAKVMLGKIIELRVKDLFKKQSVPQIVLSYPMALVFGTMFNAWRGEHWCILCRCNEGIFILEPQNMDTWIANPQDDKILFALI